MKIANKLLFSLLFFGLIALSFFVNAKTVHAGTVVTAIGEINTDGPADFVATLVRFLTGIGGGVAFLLMLFGSFKIILSAGNPESVKAGQEMITSAISGLLFIIFSIFLLQFIGVKVFGIPGIQ